MGSNHLLLVSRTFLWKTVRKEKTWISLASLLIWDLCYKHCPNWPWLHVYDNQKFQKLKLLPMLDLEKGLSDQPHNLHFLSCAWPLAFWRLDSEIRTFFDKETQQVYLLYCLLAWLLPSSQHHKAKTASSSTRSPSTPHMCFYCQLYFIASLQFVLMLCKKTCKNKSMLIFWPWLDAVL